MEVLHNRNCGLDVHKETVAACILIREAGRVRKEKRIFGTTTKELLDLADWLASHEVKYVATGERSRRWRIAPFFRRAGTPLTKSRQVAGEPESLSPTARLTTFWASRTCRDMLRREFSPPHIGHFAEM